MSYIGHGLSHAIFGGFAAQPLIGVDYRPRRRRLGRWPRRWPSTRVTRRRSDRRRRRDRRRSPRRRSPSASRCSRRSARAARASTPRCSAASSASSRADVWSLVAIIARSPSCSSSSATAQLLFATFDPEVAEVSGVNVARIDAHAHGARARLAILATLTVIGVTLVAAMLVIPAVVARMLTDSFGRMLVLSTVIGATCGALGMYASYYADVPSGP